MSIDFYDVQIILNKQSYYLLQALFVLPLSFLSQISIDVSCLKDAHVTLKSHVTVKLRHGQVKVTHIFAKSIKKQFRKIYHAEKIKLKRTTSFQCCLKAKCCLNCPAWLERDSEAYKQLRLVSNYDWLCSISGLSTSTLRGLALGSNHFSPPVTNLYVLLVSGLLINVIVCR